MFRSWAVLDGDCCCAVIPEWPPLSISLISHLTIRHVLIITLADGNTNQSS